MSISVIRLDPADSSFLVAARHPLWSRGCTNLRTSWRTSSSILARCLEEVGAGGSMLATGRAPLPPTREDNPPPTPADAAFPPEDVAVAPPVAAAAAAVMEEKCCWMLSSRVEVGGPWKEVWFWRCRDTLLVGSHTISRCSWVIWEATPIPGGCSGHNGNHSAVLLLSNSAIKASFFFCNLEIVSRYWSDRCLRFCVLARR